jgi:hypothetical protein
MSPSLETSGTRKTDSRLRQNRGHVLYVSAATLCGRLQLENRTRSSLWAIGTFALRLEEHGLRWQR